jgi:hypothetical protein
VVEEIWGRRNADRKSNQPMKGGYSGKHNEVSVTFLVFFELRFE